LLNAVEIMKE